MCRGSHQSSVQVPPGGVPLRFDNLQNHLIDAEVTYQQQFELLFPHALAAGIDGLELHLVGDCVAPRNLMIAIHEGHAVGNAL